MNYQTPETCECACCAEYACHCMDYPEAERCDCFLCRCAQGLDKPMPIGERRKELTKQGANNGAKESGTGGI